MPELLTLDPVEWDPDRVELPLNELGLEVLAEGLDYGESSPTLEKIRKLVGEGVTDRKWPNIACEVPLLVKAEDALPLAEVAEKLEQKSGLIQREGGSIRRDFDLGGGFAGSVMCPITSLGLPPLQGWMMVHRQVAPGVVLKIERSPFWYATVEIEGPEFKASAARDLQWEIAEMLGTAPGLIRLRIKNENGAGEDWRGLISAIECRDYSAGSTALPVYEAEALTLKGGAEVKERAGASGGKVVRATLTKGWQAFLGSEIPGTGHMTHLGVRRPRFRVYDPAGTAEMRLLWRALGAATWTENPIVVSPVAGGFQDIDLGEARPQSAVLGSQRWEWKLLARSPSGAGTLDIDRMWPCPTEQMLVVSETGADPVDGEPIKNPGTVADSAGVGTLAWSQPSGAAVAGGEQAFVVGAAGTKSHYLKATNFGFLIPGTATVVGMLVSMRCLTNASVVKPTLYPVIAGAIKTGSPQLSPQGVFPVNAGYGIMTFGSLGNLMGQALTPAVCNAAEFGVAITVENTGSELAQVLIDEINILIFFT